MKRSWITAAMAPLLAAVGALILAPSALFLHSALNQMQAREIVVALAPLARRPLAELRAGQGIVLKVTVPDTAQWRSIRKSWGEPRYLISAISPDGRRAYCLPDLGATVSANSSRGAVSLVSTGPGYAQNCNCEAPGAAQAALAFHASPGDEVVITARAAGAHALPAGELVVICAWDNVKDKLVGAALERELKMPAAAASTAGVLLIALAAWLHRRLHRGPR